MADVSGLEQVWTAQGFHKRFGLPFDADNIGFGHSSDDVGRVRAGAELLAPYLSAVHEQTIAYVAGLSAEDLDRIVDDRWDPPVTLVARLVSVVNDDMAHVGQAAYARGLLGA